MYIILTFQSVEIYGICNFVKFCKFKWKWKLKLKLEIKICKLVKCEALKRKWYSRKIENVHRNVKSSNLDLCVKLIHFCKLLRYNILCAMRSLQSTTTQCNITLHAWSILEKSKCVFSCSLFANFSMFTMFSNIMKHWTWSMKHKTLQNSKCAHFRVEF